MNGHIPEINGKTVREVLATSRFYSKDHLVQNIEFKVLIDLFQAFLNIRDNNLNPDRYFMFYLVAILLSLFLLIVVDLATNIFLWLLITILKLLNLLLMFLFALLLIKYLKLKNQTKGSF